MKKFTGFFDHEEKEILQETEHFHKALTHLRYEGKPTRGKNVQEAKEVITHLVKTLSKHRRLQEEIIFPYLLIHIPKHESAIQFLRADHQDIRKNKQKISLMLRKLSRNTHYREEDVKIHETGVYLICLVRHHIELEKKSIHKALHKELKQDERLEIGNRIKRWLVVHKNGKASR